MADGTLIGASALPRRGGALLVRVQAAAEAVIAVQRPHLALWVPVLLGLGIAGYFALPSEPDGAVLAGAGLLLLLGFAALSRLGPVAAVLLLAVLLPLLGAEWGALRSRIVAAPVLTREMMANVEGRVVGLDRSASERPRVLLDQVVIHGLEPGRTPARVRISLDPATPLGDVRPGVRLLGYARLSPPAPPAEPGGFDFRRMAWFDSLGAVGYSRTPFLETAGSETRSPALLAFRLRMAASAHVQARIPGQNGAFAAAILTGDRSGIDQAVEQSLRVSNLYHLVSISGLHMSLLAAAVFWIIRHGLALVPWCALHWPVKKIAAGVAIVASLAYLALSGWDVPAQRSWIMTATMLVAVLLDRPAITLRSLALSALIILAVQPESLVEAGFQMSYAATIALVASYEALRGQAWWRHTQTAPGWRLARPVIGVLMTSLIAGVATAPISAFHFNLVGQYGLLANLFAVPAMGLVVMPAAVAAVLLAPLGLDALPFWVVGKGNGFILAVSDWVASLDGAVTGVRAGPPAALVLLMLGGLFLVLWIGRGRSAGLAVIALGLAVWAASPRPELLISDGGRLFGILGPEGRVLSSDRGNGFAASNWLENDGDTAGQEAAAARPGVTRSRGRAGMEAPGIGRIEYVGSRAPTAATDGLCASAAVLIAPNWPRAPAGGCLFLGAEALRREGAMAIRPDAAGRPVVDGARSRNRGRPWTRDAAAG